MRIVTPLSLPLSKELIRRGVQRILLTRSARKNSSPAAIELLKRSGVDIIVDHTGPGRPVVLTRRQLRDARLLRERGYSYREIARRLGVSSSTVRRALVGITKFERWAEDYNGGGKVVWMETHDADPHARALADRHYSRKTRGATHFCGPGEKMVLISPDYRALFVWRKNKVRWDGQEGVECTIFRNEGAHISSELIKEAVRLARKRWPGARLFTYVWPSAIKSTDPGFCFKRAGWRVVGWNRGKRRKLLLLEAPDD